MIRGMNTQQQIDEMQVGPELDLAVANMLDVPVIFRGGEVYVGFNYSTGAGGVTGGEREFSPSTSWEDAMWAAARLLPQPWLLLHEGDHWNVRKKLGGVRDLLANEAHYHVAPLASSTSGPLSICRAILKVKASP